MQAKAGSKVIVHDDTTAYVKKKIEHYLTYAQKLAAWHVNEKKVLERKFGVLNAIKHADSWSALDQSLTALAKLIRSPSVERASEIHFNRQTIKEFTSLLGAIEKDKESVTSIRLRLQSLFSSLHPTQQEMAYEIYDYLTQAKNLGKEELKRGLHALKIMHLVEPLLRYNNFLIAQQKAWLSHHQLIEQKLKHLGLPFKKHSKAIMRQKGFWSYAKDALEASHITYTQTPSIRLFEHLLKRELENMGYLGKALAQNYTAMQKLHSGWNVAGHLIEASRHRAGHRSDLVDETCKKELHYLSEIHNVIKQAEHADRAGTLTLEALGRFYHTLMQLEAASLSNISRLPADIREEVHGQYYAIEQKIFKDSASLAHRIHILIKAFENKHANKTTPLTLFEPRSGIVSLEAE